MVFPAFLADSKSSNTKKVDESPNINPSLFCENGLQLVVDKACKQLKPVKANSVKISTPPAIILVAFPDRNMSSPLPTAFVLAEQAVDIVHMGPLIPK